jgi:large subunit ribosomal protein L25
MKIEINASVRTEQGTGASRRLRRASKVPGIVYGGGQSAQPIELDHNELYHKLRLEAFHASILDLKVAGGTDIQVLLRDYQMHPFRPIVMHADFQRVAADQKIHMKVPLHFVNGEISPGVKLSGGMISHALNEVDVLCLPADLPEFVQVDLSQLAAGHTLHLSGVAAPKGVEFPAIHRGEDPPVATIVMPKTAPVDEAAATTPSAADVPAAKQPPKEKAEEKKDDKKK